jgi:hypothetical protein
MIERKRKKTCRRHEQQKEWKKKNIYDAVRGRLVHREKENKPSMLSRSRRVKEVTEKKWKKNRVTKRPPMNIRQTCVATCWSSYPKIISIFFTLYNEKKIQRFVIGGMNHFKHRTCICCLWVLEISFKKIRCTINADESINNEIDDIRSLRSNLPFHLLFNKLIRIILHT